MKKLAPIIFLLLATTMSLSAQSNRGKKKVRTTKTETTSENKSNRAKAVDDGMKFNPRAERKFAISTETGIKTLAGTGLHATYYALPKLAIDFGGGIGVHLARFGIRGRYLFLDKKFTPYVGAGVYRNPIEITREINAELEFNGEFFILELNPSTFGQIVVGAEYMGDRGFLFGFNLGYSSAFTDEIWSTQENLSNDARLIGDLFYSSGVSFGLNLGWAF